MHNDQELRDLIRQRIHDENWTELFTGGACHFFALVLHEELHLLCSMRAQPAATSFVTFS